MIRAAVELTLAREVFAMPGERPQADDPPAGGTIIWLVRPAEPRAGEVTAFWERAEALEHAQRQAARGKPTQSVIT